MQRAALVTRLIAMTDKTTKIQVNARNRAYTFEAAGDEKILNVGLTNAIDLPYECGSGTCGTCKARLISGKIADQWPEAPGRKALKIKKGEFLMCQCTAETDIERLRNAALENGMETLRDSAIAKMLKGDTTYQEVLRVTTD